MSEDVVAIFCSDLHISHKCPAFRSGEKDWYAAQARVLIELSNLQEQCEDAPIFFAGDLFHHWNEPAEAINFCLRGLPESHGAIPAKFYAIYGQHDMPLHQKRDMHKSAFQTLVQAGKICALEEEEIFHLALRDKSVSIYPCPWGYPIESLGGKGAKDEFHIALCHEYIWTDEKGYPGAPNKSHIKSVGKRLKGYTHAFFGDNHHSFQETINGCIVTNCGTMQRRNVTELNYVPKIWLLTNRGRVIPHVIYSITADVYLKKANKEITVDVGDLAEAFKSLFAERNQVDLPTQISYALRKMNLGDGVDDILRELLEELNK